jgi:uridine phosphorylase
VVGAPYAALVLESLIAWGARQVLFLGWCGAIAPSVEIGDIILPTAAFRDEGTSVHYGAGAAEKPILPAPTLVKEMRSVLEAGESAYREGGVWSTDAVYRETPEKIAHFRQLGASVVEMEISALFTVGRFRGVEVAALLVVSDDLSRLVWRPGFKSTPFREGRRQAIAEMVRLCRRLETLHY